MPIHAAASAIDGCRQFLLRLPCPRTAQDCAGPAEQSNGWLLPCEGLNAWQGVPSPVQHLRVAVSLERDEHIRSMYARALAKANPGWYRSQRFGWEGLAGLRKRGPAGGVARIWRRRYGPRPT